MFDDSKVCGRVWKHNFLAYRCKTCALSPCMSLCNECFHQGDHKGHDYNMFRSQAGGACDCGDENVLLPSGLVSCSSAYRFLRLRQFSEITSPNCRYERFFFRSFHEDSFLTNYFFAGSLNEKPVKHKSRVGA